MIYRLWASLLGLSVAVGSWPAVAQAPTAKAESAQIAAGVTRATAAELARVVAPLDLMVGVELEQARKAILALPDVDKDAKQLEADYPGLYAALWTEVEPELRRQTIADYPSYWAALEQLYVSRLSENEAQAVMRFFKSATGQKLIRNMYGAFDAAPLLADMAKKDDYTFNEQQMKAVTDAAKAKAVKQLGTEDHADLWILMASIQLDKFRALGAETQKLTLDWVNKEDADSDAKIGEIMQDAMEQYMEAHPPKK